MGATLILAKNTGEGFKYARQIGLKQGSFRLVRDAHAIRGVRHAEVHLLPSFLERWDRHTILGALKWARTLEVFYVDPADIFPPERDDFEHLDPRDADKLVPSDPTGLSEEEKVEIESHLEPEGFELSSDPAVQAQQILESAARIDPEVEAELEQIDHDPEFDADTAAQAQQIIDGVEYDWGLSTGTSFDFPEESSAQTTAPEQVEDPAPTQESRKGRRRSRCKSCGTLHWKDESCPEDVADPIDVPAEPVRAANEVTRPSGGDIFDFIGKS